MRVDRAIVGVVSVGGAAGAAARYGLGVAFPDHGGFPWTTFTINVTGCLAIGALVAVLGLLANPHRLARPLLGTGFLGGFTTFSTYADQARELASTGHWGLAGAYVGSTLVAALAAVWIGTLGARVATGRTS